MSSTTPHMRLHGARMLDAGFHIIPIAAAKKFPGEYSGGRWQPMTSWSRFAHHKPSEATVDMWCNYPGSGVGIVTGGASGVIGVDLDILDEAVAQQVKQIIFKHLGVTPLVRVGRAPKTMLVYRVGAPMNKIAMHPIEVLATGQQFVAYGVHPDTGLDYHWPVESPDDTTVESLPLVAEAQVRAAVEEAYAMIPSGMKRARLIPESAENAPTGTVSSETAPATIEAITEALQAIPNADVQWDDWKKILMAVFVSSRGSEEAYFQFLAWSRKSAKHNDTTTRNEWNGCKVSVPKRINFGTLHYIAKANGWVPSAGLHFNTEKRDAPPVDTSVFESWPLQPANGTPDFRTTAEQVIAAHPEQRTEVLRSVGLEREEVVDPITGEITEVLHPTRDTLGLTATAYTKLQLKTIIEAKAGNLFDMSEPPRLELTQVEIENGTMPRALADAFPQEWLFTSSLIGRVAHWVDSCSLYPHRLFALMAAFTMFGSIVGRQYRTRSDMRPNLSVCIIGKTGAGKEASRKSITKLLMAAGLQNKIGPRGGFSSGSGVVEGLQNQPSMWLALDEFGKKIAAYSGKGDQNQREMIAMFLEAIANDYLGGKGYANSVENVTRNVVMPNLNIYGSSQMEEITGALSSAASNDGFIQRFLFVPTFADYVPMRRDFEAPAVPQPLIDEIKFIAGQLEMLGGLMATNDDPASEPEMVIVEVTREAQEMIYRLDDRKLELLKADRNMWVRSVAQTIKIAMLEAIATNAEFPLITEEGLDNARKLVDWFTRYAETYVASKIADNETERDLKKMRALIADGGGVGVSKSHITGKFHRLSPRQREEIIKTLIDGGDIEEGSSPAKGANGKKTTMYRLLVADLAAPKHSS